MLQNKSIRQFSRFGIAGTVGFLTDAGAVVISTTVFGFGPIPAQVIGFSIAVVLTWLINRYWTFSENSSNRWLLELTRYIAANSLGATINNTVYIALVILISVFRHNPTYAVAVGSLVGMVSNFIMSRKYAFQDKTISN